jgi:diguanylate cyclase (GGDEF)-like protein
MPGLDLFTLNCVTVANMLLSSGAMYCVSRLNPRTDGIMHCSFAGLMVAAGFILGAINTLAPARMLNFGANLVIFAGATLMLDGVRAFRGQHRLALRIKLAAAATYISLYALWLYGFDSLRARTVLASLAVGILMLSCAGAMAAHVEHRDRAVYWSTASIYGIQGIAITLRALQAIFATPAASLFSHRSIDFLNVATLNLASIATVFGLSLATNLKLNRETVKLALYDTLTNLPNRRLFEERLRDAENRAASTGCPVALLYCDLDDFKTVNDTLGHEAGDEVLRGVAERLRNAVPPGACLARVGGDEFVILIENAAPRESLILLADRLRHAIEGPIEVCGQSILPRMSCGLAVYPEDVGSASDLVRLADAAMYAMKQHGRMPYIEEPVNVRV